MSAQPSAVSHPPVVENDSLIIAGVEYQSRLLVGTGRYKDMAQTKAAIEASGAEIITTAVRRLSFEQQQELISFLPSRSLEIEQAGEASRTSEPSASGASRNWSDSSRNRAQNKSYQYLPNTAGCYTAEEAIRTLRLAREAGSGTLIKLEVIGEEKTLYPNVVETLKATEILISEGFDVMAYTTDDLIVAKELEKLGCVAVMPLGAPIGSGLGIQNPLNIKLIVEQLSVPVLVDAGVGTASDAAIAMELGCDGVLMNTAIAEADDPIRMAKAMKHAVIAGREAYLAGRMPKREYAVASSPITS